eukprot:COSAG06_NODE_31433_length_521_cov_2.689573_1_plen_110_part_10
MPVTCPPRGRSIASVARSAGLHPLRISPYGRRGAETLQFSRLPSITYILTILILLSAPAAFDLQHYLPLEAMLERRFIHFRWTTFFVPSLAVRGARSPTPFATTGMQQQP